MRIFRARIVMFLLVLFLSPLNSFGDDSRGVVIKMMMTSSHGMKSQIMSAMRGQESRTQIKTISKGEKPHIINFLTRSEKSKSVGYMLIPETKMAMRYPNMDQMMSAKNSANGVAVKQVSWKPGKTETSKMGIPCQWRHGFQNGKKEMSLCLSKDPRVMKFMDAFAKLSQAQKLSQSQSSNYPSQVEGFPLMSKSFHEEQVVSSWVTGMSQQKLAASFFAIPKGYKTMDFSGLNQLSQIDPGKALKRELRETASVQKQASKNLKKARRKAKENAKQEIKKEIGKQVLKGVFGF